MTYHFIQNGEFGGIEHKEARTTGSTGCGLELEVYSMLPFSQQDPPPGEFLLYNTFRCQSLSQSNRLQDCPVEGLEDWPLG